MIVDIGETLGFDVVAEGVETNEQLNLLRRMGCRIVQGFLFTGVIDADAAMQLLGRPLVARSDA
jgi:EAL domain-containing protein (putative c-di-GMP-specific phosphodiesterase class I)